MRAPVLHHVLTAACVLLAACSSSDREPAADVSTTPGAGGHSAGSGGTAGAGPSGTGGGGDAGDAGNSAGIGGGNSAGAGGVGSAGMGGGGPKSYCEANECGSACTYKTRQVTGTGFAPSDEGKSAEFFVRSWDSNSYYPAGQAAITAGAAVVVVVFHNVSCGSPADLLVVVDRDGSGGCSEGDLVQTVHLGSIGFQVLPTFPNGKIEFAIESGVAGDCSLLSL